jgi:sulfur oxygenase/reductase
MHGHESQFEEGAIQTLTWMKENVPGMVGWMLLKQFGVSAIGSFQLDPQGMLKATLGANPPTTPTMATRFMTRPRYPQGLTT